MCLAIGVRGANALMAIFLGKRETAQKMASEIKDAASKLSIESGEIENAIKQLDKAMNSPDDKNKDRRIRMAINNVERVITEELQKQGDIKYARLITYGAWIESVRQISGIINDNYKVLTSGYLGRTIESEYFIQEFAMLNAKSKSDLFADIISTTKALDSRMELGENHSISKGNIAEIQSISSKFLKENI